MHERHLFRARLVASAAATVVSLAAGTNYVYSAWAPQFADRLKLSATDSNLIGLAGNLGMYTLGLPIGIFVDSRGPRPAVLGGAILMGLGYFWLQRAYESATASVAALCVLSYLTGLGGCMSFMAAMKASALNWPHHRGTATGFPLAAFGLSAFFFSFLGSSFFPGDTGAFLEILALGTSVMTATGFFLIRVIPVSTPREPQGARLRGGYDGHSSPSRHHSPIVESGTLPHPALTRIPDLSLGSPTPTSDVGVQISMDISFDDDDSVITSGNDLSSVSLMSHDDGRLLSVATPWLQPSTFERGAHRQLYDIISTDGYGQSCSKSGYDIGTHATALVNDAACLDAPMRPGFKAGRPFEACSSTQVFDSTSSAQPSPPEGSSRMLEQETESVASEESSLLSTTILVEAPVLEQHIDSHHFCKVDIRGTGLLRHVEFWLLWVIMGLLAGVGLMTINNIGNNATALWRHLDPSIDDAYLISRHQMHVSILSIGSFSGRLLSGLGSDFLIKVLHASRLWCLVIGSLIFVMAQVSALMTANPYLLMFVSGLSGLGYGFVFGVLPSIVAEMFGVRGLSQNWGMMTLSPVVSGYIFNVFYGSVYDRQSTIGADGGRICLKGLDCYRSAYVSTLVACLIGLGLTLWTIWRQHRHRGLDNSKPRD